MKQRNVSARERHTVDAVWGVLSFVGLTVAKGFALLFAVVLLCIAVGELLFLSGHAAGKSIRSEGHSRPPLH